MPMRLIEIPHEAGRLCRPAPRAGLDCAQGGPARLGLPPLHPQAVPALQLLPARRRLGRHAGEPAPPTGTLRWLARLLLFHLHREDPARHGSEMLACQAALRHACMHSSGESNHGLPMHAVRRTSAWTACTAPAPRCCRSAPPPPSPACTWRAATLSRALCWATRWKLW